MGSFKKHYGYLDHKNAHKADGIEGDVRRTKDGILVISNQSDLEMMTNGSRTIENTEVEA